MSRYKSQTGAALIMLIGMIGALAILASTLVLVVVNQQFATANVREKTQSLYIDEAALDSGVRIAEIGTPMPTVSPSVGTGWLDQAMLDQFASYFPYDAGTGGVTITYYDDLNPLNPAIKWDSNGNRRMWIQAEATYHQKKTKSRVMVQQMTVPFAAALPKAVTYSDTGITLNDTSNVYAVTAEGSPWPTTSPSPATYISAGGTWIPSMSSSRAEVGRFTVSSKTSQTLKAPTGVAQSLGIKANGSVKVGSTTYTTSSPGDQVPVSPATATYKYTKIGAGTVGFLSDYFDQAAQASLVDESQEGSTPAPTPTAPTAMSPTPTATPDATTLSTWTNTSSITAVDASGTDYKVNGNLALNRNGSSGRTFSFRDLYVTGDLSITGPITFNARNVHVGGTLTITGRTDVSVTDTISGTVYVAGTTSNHRIIDRVSLSAGALYCAGSLLIDNTTSTGVTDSIAKIWTVKDFLVDTYNSSSTGPVTVNASTYLYAGGDITLEGPSSGTVTDTFGLIYAAGTKSVNYSGGERNTVLFYGNVNVKATAVTSYTHEFTISNATTAVKDWLGAVYVYAKSSSSDASLNRGTIKWSGTASVTSRDYLAYAADSASLAAEPKPMWLGRYFNRTGDYDDEYGNVWIPGNSSTSVVFDCDSGDDATVMCPLLCTTEKNTWSGNVTYGSRTKPMVFFYVCDNNGIYPQVVDWTGTGTYYGLMVINESTIDFSGDTTSTTPTVEGAVFAGCPYDPTHTSGMSMSDIVLNDSDSIAFNQAVVGAIATSSLKTTTTITQTVPGSWQQLPVN